MRPFKQRKGDARGRYEIERIAEKLQVALGAFRHAQPWQVKQTPEFRHPVLRCPEGTYPATEEDPGQQYGGQQPGAHVPGAGDESQAENETRHEDKLHKEARNLNFTPFSGHRLILWFVFSKINGKYKFALFF